MEPYSYDIEIQSFYPLQQLITTCSSFLLLILNLAVVHGNCSNTLTSTLIQNQLILLEELVNVLDNVSKYRCCKSFFILFIFFFKIFLTRGNHLCLRYKEASNFIDRVICFQKLHVPKIGDQWTFVLLV